MCLGENNADHASHYINAQLGALYENAIQCTQRQESSHLKAYERVRYDFALAEWFYPPRHKSSVAAVEDMLFAAEFGRPILEFICNHEAIIHLRLRRGHMNLDFAKASHPGLIPSRDRNVTLDNVDVSFRVPFVVSGIQGQTKEIGNGMHVIKLMILDTLRPRFVTTSESQLDQREALTYYLKRYLEYTREAGHHVFYSLPDWDNDGNPQSLVIDFSAMTDVMHLDFGGIDFHGVPIESINSRLSKVWLEAAMIVEREESYFDYRSVCLAEYRSTWTDIGDIQEQFRVRFDAPKVRLLCDKEAVLYFKISELAFFATDDFTRNALRVFHDWEIAFLVNLVYEVNSEGIIVNIKFDFDTCRFIEHLCTYGKRDEDIGQFDHATLIYFLDHYYFRIIEEASRHIIYTHSMPVIVGDGFEDYDQGLWREIDLGKHTELVTHKERITKTYMQGFDYIQAITQTQAQRSKVLEHLACLVKWSYEKNFGAIFGAIQVRLLSSAKAVILVSLQEGTMVPLRDGVPYTAYVFRFVLGGSHGFDKWVLAFEVDIKLVDHEGIVEHCGSWVTRFKDSPAGKLHGGQGHVHFQHIMLDLTTAQFIPGLSHSGGMYLGNRHAIALVQSAIHYVKHDYFQVLASHGHHILYTIPVWSSRLDIPASGLTSVNFHIYSKVTYARERLCGLCEPFQLVVMIIGMCDFREWPADYLEYSAEWTSWTIMGSAPLLSYGTVCIARRLFFEERLLSILSKVNLSTTITATFSGVEGGEWILQVATRAEHEGKHNSNCDWRLANESADALEYEWDMEDEWNYERRGMSQESKNGSYWLRSHTHNDLSIPTAYKQGGFQIKVKGTVILENGFKESSKEWSTKAVASWSTVVALVTEGSSLKVKVWDETRPVINTTHFHKEFINTRFTPLHELLETYFPSKIDLVELSEQLQTSFCGDWKSCYPGLAAYGLANPCFNRRGDIMFDLISRPTTASRPVGAALIRSWPDSRFKSRVPSSNYGPKSPTPKPLNNPPPKEGTLGDGPSPGAGQQTPVDYTQTNPSIPRPSPLGNAASALDRKDAPATNANGVAAAASPIEGAPPSPTAAGNHAASAQQDAPAPEAPPASTPAPAPATAPSPAPASPTTAAFAVGTAVGQES
ncbi:hypothetical protein OE88DRAFT_1749327 [Heliocybe sulcata]|uniref:Uncharacterized protein n=1 Tax=Heliocybe sulcata TaxID=5364 RepID=A0A5C3MYL1_9AGAM|nr:hypothetical protein OE88DRAFT_1749327 [Heliocybe sulcata]